MTGQTVVYAILAIGIVFVLWTPVVAALKTAAAKVAALATPVTPAVTPAVTVATDPVLPAATAATLLDFSGKYSVEARGAESCLTLSLIAKETNNEALSATAATAFQQLLNPASK